MNSDRDKAFASACLIPKMKFATDLISSIQTSVNYSIRSAFNAIYYLSETLNFMELLFRFIQRLKK